MQTIGDWSIRGKGGRRRWVSLAGRSAMLRELQQVEAGERLSRGNGHEWLRVHTGDAMTRIEVAPQQR